MCDCISVPLEYHKRSVLSTTLREGGQDGVFLLDYALASGLETVKEAVGPAVGGVSP